MEITGAHQARVLKAAREYANAGWAVAPGAVALGDQGHPLWRLIHPDAEVTVQCSCGNRYCTTPAAHPLETDWRSRATTDLDVVEQCWGVPDAPNLILPTGLGFDVLSAGTAVGAQAMRVMEHAFEPYVAVARTADSRWLFFTSPASEPFALPEGLDAVHLGDGSWTPAPPSSRGPLGRDRWVWPWRPRHDRLPAFEDVLLALVAAGRSLASTGAGRTAVARRH